MCQDIAKAFICAPFMICVVDRTVKADLTIIARVVLAAIRILNHLRTRFLTAQRLARAGITLQTNSTALRRKSCRALTVEMGARNVTLHIWRARATPAGLIIR